MARFYAGIHFFVDILAGVALGISIAVFICKVFMPRVEPFPSWAMNLFRFLYLA
jgi:membrane-associated phospholipid phosphatase